MSDPALPIEAVDLWKSFRDRDVLRGLGLRLAPGEIAALTGANGSGKTTLLRCLAGAVRPTVGEVRWFGEPAGVEPRSRRVVGFAAHESGLYPHLSLRENLLFAARMCHVPRAAARADGLLATIGLADHARRLPGEVSQGMRQRVSLARVLIHEPPILLLDEPFAGLDAEGTAWLDRLLAGRRGMGGATIFSTHDPAHAQRLADRVLRLHAGRLDAPSPLDRHQPAARAA